MLTSAEIPKPVPMPKIGDNDLVKHAYKYCLTSIAPVNNTNRSYHETSDKAFEDVAGGDTTLSAVSQLHN